MLEVKNITKWFKGVHALTDVSVQFNEFEIHGLVGENGAGKSTLMKIVSGVFHADSGEIFLDGKSCRFQSPQDAYDAGIRIVHQELSLLESLTVAENLFIHRFRKGSFTKFIDRKVLNEDAKKILEYWKIDINPATLVSKTSISVRQMVEIARELSTEGKVIILDEPTSSLTENEIIIFFEFVRRLKDKGYIVIFISHRINEVIELVDKITILRDGFLIDSRATKDMTPKEIVRLIADKELSELFPKSEVPIGETVFEVKDLNGPGCQNISFSVRSGEIVGFAGLVGAGRSETMKTIFGILSRISGSIRFQGKELSIKRPYEAISEGIMMLSENRGEDGIFPLMSVSKNIIIMKLKEVCSKLFLSKHKIEQKTNNGVSNFNIITSNAYQQLISQLSGGNQQKVIFARLLEAKPKMLLLDEPTRGIDVNNKSEIHKIIGEFVRQGGAVAMVSSEIDEILGVCDSIIVLNEGRMVGEFTRNDFHKEGIIKCMMGV